MKCPGKAVAGLIVAAILLLSGSVVAWSATIVKDGDTNTIGAAIAQQDGSTVTLTCEQVIWCGKSGKSFAIKEWTERQPQQPRLLVISTVPLPVKDYWSVDITGTIQTFAVSLPTGATYQQRVVIVSPENVQIYCDLKGKPYPFPIFKGLLDSWATKRPLTSSAVATGTAGQLPVPPDTPDAPLPIAGSRDTIKSLPDGAPVSINGAVVSCSISGRFAVERADRSFAVWANSASSIPKGTLVDITGRMSTEAGSRIVIADSVNTLDTDYPVASLVGMNNRNLNYGLDTSGMSAVRVWGKVTDVHTNERIFFIDDGSNLDAGSGHIGVKIYDYSNDALPSVDDYVAVNGASSVESPGIRVILKTEPGTTTYATLLMQMETGTGAISGTITAAGADGSSVRVYCGKASTTATFVGGTASYTLRVPYGRHAVTATVAGYRTTTRLVRANSVTPNQQCDMVLPTVAKVIDIVSSPSGTLADGTKETAVTAIVRDEEGRRCANIPIGWNPAGNVVFSADTVTDAVGEAKAILRHSATAVQASVEVNAGAVISRSAVN